MTYEELVQKMDGVSSFQEKLALLSQHKDLLAEHNEAVKNAASNNVPPVIQPEEESQSIFSETEGKKKKRAFKTNSQKNKWVFSPSLIMNSFKISSKEKKIQKENLKRRKSLALADTQKVSSEKSFLRSLPRNTIGKLINFTLYKYGEWYADQLDKDLEDERLDRLEDAEKIDRMYQKEQHKESVANVIAALKDNDEQILQSQQAKIDRLDGIDVIDEIDRLDVNDEIDQINAFEQEPEGPIHTR